MEQKSSQDFFKIERVHKKSRVWSNKHTKSDFDLLASTSTLCVFVLRMNSEISQKYLFTIKYAQTKASKFNVELREVCCLAKQNVK